MKLPDPRASRAAIGPSVIPARVGIACDAETLAAWLTASPSAPGGR